MLKRVFSGCQRICRPQNCPPNVEAICKHAIGLTIKAGAAERLVDFGYKNWMIADNDDDALLNAALVFVELKTKFTFFVYKRFDLKFNARRRSCECWAHEQIFDLRLFALL